MLFFNILISGWCSGAACRASGVQTEANSLQPVSSCARRLELHGVGQQPCSVFSAPEIGWSSTKLLCTYKKHNAVMLIMNIQMKMK